MWLFTVIGFFSVIEHRDDKELLLIRARVKGDLERLKEKFLPNLGPILATPTGADYPYRALAWRSDFSNAMLKMVSHLNYTNFKSAVSKNQDWPRHDLYMKVWSIMKSAESTLRDLERKEKERGKSGSSQGVLWTNGAYWEDSRSGRFGGKGDKKYKQYTDLPDRRAAIKARNERLAKNGSPKLKREVEAERWREQKRVEEIVRKSLKGTAADFDKEFESEEEAAEDALAYSYGVDPGDLDGFHIEPEDVGLVDPDDEKNKK